MGLVAKALLFLSSYIPLWLILILFHSADRNWIFWGASVALGAGIVGLAILLSWVSAIATTQVTVEDASRQDGDSVAYIVTYILPFLSLMVTTTLEAAGVAVLFGTVLIVYVSSDMLYVNPILASAGLRAHAVHTTGGVEVVVLTRKRLISHGKLLHVAELTDGIWWDRGDSS